MVEKEKTERSAKAEAKVHAQMLISYTPGEECRVAVVEEGALEEFHAERASSISRVGNIYIGTVTNVEPAIQAAFIDFGIEHHGFLHVTDVHPRYFPGEDDDTTERVGKKTPRRERPPIQKCFRRGDQVEVQVLKEGVGTKGPTLTSYLSIPGRFLVMMPQMDRVGVSRKVEDEEQRRAMRDILDQLELPEGFGFIVRTAGMDRNKTELKRDLAYLQRLWKDMETRRKTGNKPRLLYSESDLLVRALRDMVSADIDEIIIDNDLALARAARFLKIVAPRSKVKLLQYSGQTPLFHAYGIEHQLALMHAREVPLPSGGRLVIDETEALVAIDVNSGKMRDARDAETNAYRTNCEAVEEICRQLKLRDLGGIVINDLIDMRHASHRKDIEQRFRDRLKRDRARTTTLAISDFGILEMTRQRMRGSHESVHFVDCPTCRGRGMVQKPDSVAADALRNLAALLDHANVGRVEMVVSPRVASELLSGRRKTLNKIERTSGKHVDVRVSETVPVDRVSFYAYDPEGADIDVEALPKSKSPADLKVWELSKEGEEETWAADFKEGETPAEPDLTPAEQVEIEEMPAHPIEFDIDEPEGPPLANAGAGQPGGENGEGGRRRRRRRRRGRGRGGQDGPPQGQPQGPQQGAPADQNGAVMAPAGADGEFAPVTDRPLQPGAPQNGADGQFQQGQAGPDGQPGGRRRRRRRRGRGGRSGGGGGNGGGPDGPLDGGGQPGAPMPDAQPQAFDEPPRGDSWDLPASAVPALPAPVPHEQPLAVNAEPGAEETQDQHDGQGLEGDHDQDEAPEPVSAGGPPMAGQPLPPGPGEGQGEGGGRRRRRRRRGRGGRGGQGGPPQQGGEPGGAPPQQPVQQQPQQPKQPRQQSQPRQPQPPRPQQPRRPQPPHAQPPSAPPPQGGPPREPRTGGGYQRRQPAAESPSSPPPPPLSAPPPAHQSGPAPEPKPKRFLYTSRRRLSPGELPRGGEE